MEGHPLAERIRRVAALNAAQRALARAIHPSELAHLTESSRGLLIELRELLDREEQSRGERGLLSASVLDHFDRAFDEQAERTRGFVARIDMRELRATIPMIAHQHPEEVHGLIDVLLTGPLVHDKTLRLLEYLITLASAEEHSGRRTLVNDPTQLTLELQHRCHLACEESDSDWVVSERMLDTATGQVLQGGDVGSIRDRVRRRKEEYGVDLLHPRVLTAAVKYNLAMWNQVAAEIDSSRSIDEWAGTLFAETGDLPVPTVGGSGSSILDSQAFDSLLAEFSARVRGDEGRTARFDRLLDRLDVSSLAPELVEDFDEITPDDCTRLLRSAVLMGRVLCDFEANREPLASAGLDPIEFATEAYDALVSRMTEAARKQFSESVDGAAFHLSDVKTHHLTTHRAIRDALVGPEMTDAPADRHAPEERSGTGPLRHRLFGVLPVGREWIGLFALIPLVALYLSPSIVENPVLSANELASISPFLVSADVQLNPTSQQVVAHVSDTWAYLRTGQRREIAQQIANAFGAREVDGITLLDSRGVMVMRFANGSIVLLVPHPEDSAEVP